ncbi:MAG: hypothetical protein A2V86_11140 [Deltaproteobacteria bacterium RBG_16_49_23]|nr:MAG: hypothetical protein A2V86_11140 [Deltaproteobacteria bacterium RBG_16_49_23]
MRKKTRFLYLALALFLSGHGSAIALTATPIDDVTVTALTISQTLMPGLGITGLTTLGGDEALGIFTGTTPVDGVSIPTGIILSTGRVENVPGPNFGESNGQHLRAGDPALDALIAGPTLDAAGVQFSFTPTQPVAIFNIVFSSDEYMTGVGGSNDVFGLFINGTNIALVPGTLNPMSVLNIDKILTPTLFKDNDHSPLGAPSAFAIEADGMTRVMKARVLLTPGVAHTLKVVIADGPVVPGAADDFGDSTVFMAPAKFLTPRFGDVAFANIFLEYVEEVLTEGITLGCSANPLLYCPGDLVNRGQMAAFLARAVDGVDPTACLGTVFPDVPVGYPFCAHIERVAALGIALGFVDGTFKPADLVNREQMAAFLIRGVEGNPAGTCAVQPFTDVTVPNVFCKHIERIRDLEITLGFADGTYKPLDTVNREQMAAFLARAFLGLF